MPIKSGAGVVVFLFWDWEEITQLVIKAFNAGFTHADFTHGVVRINSANIYVGIVEKYLYVTMHFCQFLLIVIIEEEKTENMCFKLTI